MKAKHIRDQVYGHMNDMIWSMVLVKIKHANILKAYTRARRKRGHIDMCQPVWQQLEIEAGNIYRRSL